MTFFVFYAFDATHGNELWGSDGTPAGTRLIKDIFPGHGSSGLGADGAWGPSSFTDLGDGRALFSANDGLAGTQLWVTDGTTEGTVLLKAINPEVLDGTMYFPFVVSREGFTPVGDGQFLFEVHGANGYELWITDGTTDGTELLSDLTIGETTWSNNYRISQNHSSPTNFIALGDGRVLFSANGLYDDETGESVYEELWVTDGTAEGTHIFEDLIRVHHFTQLPDGRVIFVNTNAEWHYDLWVTDGTAEGTMMVMYNIDDRGSLDFAILNDGRAVFSQGYHFTNPSTWVTDGTPEGTHLLTDVPPELAPTTPTKGGGLWITEQDEDGTTRLVDLNSGWDFVSSPYSTVEDGRTFFQMHVQETGEYGLWVTDGTANGTSLVFQGVTRPAFADLGDGRVAFYVADEQNGWQPWVTDGTAGGTYALKDRLAGVATRDFSTSTEDLSITLLDGTVEYPDDGVIGHHVLTAIDRVIAGAGNDSIVGNSYHNDISGGAGDDYIVGGIGLDIISGGSGNDFICCDCDYYTSRYPWSLPEPNRSEYPVTEILRGDDGDDCLVVHAAHDIVLVALGAVLDGGAGNDTLCAISKDTVFGGDGHDLLYALPNDTWSIDLGATSIEWMYAGKGNDVIDATSQTEGVAVFANGGNDRIVGSAFSDQLWGGDGSDALIGASGDDTLVGGTGDDSLSAGDGNDRLFVDSADTSIDGGAGYDVVYVVNGSGIVLDLHASAVEWVADLADGDDTLDGSQLEVDITAFAGGGVDLVMGGAGNDFLWGEAGDDVIAGGAGDDTLAGGSGGDVLDGGSGTDAIYLGSGDGVLDRVVFEAGSGTDFVFDFVHGEDKLDLSALGTSFDALTITDWDGHAHVQVGTGLDLIVVANMGGQLTSEDFAF